jgi:hypothetical protein
MKINSTTQVDEIKQTLKTLFNKNIEVLTTSGNIAGDNRKVRALTSNENVEFPVVIQSESFDGFLRQCKRRLGLKIIIPKTSKEAIESLINSQSNTFEIGNLNFQQIPDYFMRLFSILLKQKNYSGCVELNRSLIQFVNANIQYYWLLPLASRVFDIVGDDEEIDFTYSISWFGLNVDHDKLTVVFDEVRDIINAEAPFEQAKDFKWYISEKDREERINGDTFIAAVLKKNNAKMEDFEDPIKSELLFNLCISTFCISSEKWINNCQSESEDLVESLATLYWTVIESVGSENQVLNEFTNHLPIFVIENLIGEEIENYNSEENSEYSSYRDYSIDWKAVAASIHEGAGFGINDYGPLGAGFCNSDELESSIGQITNTENLVALKSGSYMGSKDLPSNKMSIVDFLMIQHFFGDSWLMPTSAELKEMYDLRANDDYNFELSECYISSENPNVLSTGVLFFDDGEFDERNGKIFAGKIRMVKREMD